MENNPVYLQYLSIARCHSVFVIFFVVPVHFVCLFVF